MPEYRRFIAYFYEYINGKKQKNAGFAKVELRSGMWRILFRLTTDVVPEPPIKVYGFVREDEYLLGVPMGTMRPGREAEEWAYRAESPIAQNYRLEDLAGIWIQSGEGRRFLTVWDDEPVDAERLVLEIPRVPERVKDTERSEKADTSKAEDQFETADNSKREERSEISRQFRAETFSDGQMELLHSAEVVSPAVSQTEDTEVVELRRTETGVAKAGVIEVGAAETKNVEAGVAEPKTETVQARIADAGAETEAVEAEIPEIEATKKETTETQIFEEEVTQTRTLEMQITKAGTAEVQTAETAAIDAESDRETEIAPRAIEIEETQPSSEPQTIEPQTTEPQTIEPQMIEPENIAAAQESADVEAAASVEPISANAEYIEETSSGHRSDVVQDLFHKRQQLQPVPNAGFTNCVMIMPCDIVRMQQEGWQVGRSSFLQHAFHQHRHLLLGMTEDGAYVLGVPGIQNPQEQYMAELFGFADFKLSRICGCRRVFGYWCRPLCRG